MPLASLGSDISSFGDAVSKFFSNLAHVHFGALALGLIVYALHLTLGARAYFNGVRAAYPAERIPFRRVWGAYIAAFGFNGVVPAKGGGVIKLFLVKTSVRNSTYSTVASTFLVEAFFNFAIAVPILIFAFTQGVFPKPPDFSKLHAFDLSFFAGHFRFTLFLLTALAVLALLAFALLSSRVKAFWARVRQGLTIYFDRERYLREVFALQLVAWCLKFTAYWFLLDAFRVGGSFRNVMLVMGVNAVASVVPLTPGGAGVQQALLVQVFAGAASGATIAAYSVGQQIAIAAFSLALGFIALVTIFRFRSFKDVIAAGRADRERERERAAAIADPGAPRAPA
ncbi:MAG TPA: lysylphosphatidylglycerol synthase transmembrane domain-containing protein [Solirubrobacteraceae bacterium]|nr:lysylphosphatidylglycerol synthase transmembrane domain-containing protein [Solirubrobacteraceae bacterium]